MGFDNPLIPVLNNPFGLKDEHALRLSVLCSNNNNYGCCSIPQLMLHGHC